MGWFTHVPKEPRAERGFARVVVPLAFVAAGYGAYRIAHATDDAPAIAFKNHLLYGALLFLAIFYGALLLLLPLARAIFAGELPTELSTKGPRYPERELISSRIASEELGARIDEVAEKLDKQAKLSSHNALTAAEAVADLAGDLESLKKKVDEQGQRIDAR
ncbi:MAG TPA: hypothetical protein VF009_06585 [Solirubrobacterales bacterium]